MTTAAAAAAAVVVGGLAMLRRRRAVEVRQEQFEPPRDRVNVSRLREQRQLRVETRDLGE